jgi:hypothetical protein
MLTQEVTGLLHRAGFYHVRTGDAGWVADLIRSRGGKPNLTFLPELGHGPSEAFVLFHAGEHGDRFAATISWRIIETDDYVARMRDGTEWAPDAEAVEFQHWPIREAPTIAGRVHDRGAIWADPEFRGGRRLSWYLTGLHLPMMVEDGADFVVSHALPGVGTSKLPRYVYGYDHVDPLPEHRFPWYRHPFVNHMVWSDAHGVRQEVTRRLRFLRQYDADDLGAAGRAWERYKQSVEGPAAPYAATVQERDARQA